MTNTQLILFMLGCYIIACASFAGACLIMQRIDKKQLERENRGSLRDR